MQAVLVPEAVIHLVMEFYAIDYEEVDLLLILNVTVPGKNRRLFRKSIIKKNAFNIRQN